MGRMRKESRGDDPRGGFVLPVTDGRSRGEEQYLEDKEGGNCVRKQGMKGRRDRVVADAMFIDAEDFE